MRGLASLTLGAALLLPAGPGEAAPKVALELIAAELTHPVALAAPAGDPRRFVVEQTGRIWIIDAAGRMLERPFLDLRSRMAELDLGFDERGALGLAFHPDYDTNGRFFVHYSAPLRPGAPEGFDHTSRVSEFRVSRADPNQADPDSERIVLEVDQPRWMHNGGSVAFDHAGQLLISLGDGGIMADAGYGELGYAQAKDQLLGKILRIDVGSHPYRIPKDNPFVGNVLYRPEIFALGFRNPYRCSVDRGGEGALYCGDAGQHVWEEVNLVRPGENYGWRIKEGPDCFNVDDPFESLGPCEVPGLTGPIIAYPNCATREPCTGRSVTGGYVYRGEAIPDLQGYYVFGDWAAAKDELGPGLFAAAPEPEGGWAFEPLEIVGAPFENFVLGFGEDGTGELYVLASRRTGPDKLGGRVFKIIPAPAQDVLEISRAR